MIIRPEPSSRHPIVVLFLLICLFSGAFLVLGGPAPGSIEAQLSDFGSDAWGYSLAIGSFITLAGLAIQPYTRLLLAGVRLEVLGVTLLWPSAIVYTTAALSAVGWSAGLPAFFAAGFGVACFYRMFTLIRQIVRALRIQAAESDGVHADGWH
ncbi:MAG: hypothetical protein ABIP03_04775 [Aquihabitans sp.]